MSWDMKLNRKGVEWSKQDQKQRSTTKDLNIFQMIGKITPWWRYWCGRHSWWWWSSRSGPQQEFCPATRPLWVRTEQPELPRLWSLMLLFSEAAQEVSLQRGLLKEFLFLHLTETKPRIWLERGWRILQRRCLRDDIQIQLMQHQSDLWPSWFLVLFAAHPAEADATCCNSGIF